MTNERLAQMRAEREQMRRMHALYVSGGLTLRRWGQLCAEFVPDAITQIERLEEVARDHDCPSLTLCPKHAMLEVLNLFACAYCEIERLTIERNKARDAHAALCPYNKTLATLRGKVKELRHRIETRWNDQTVTDRDGSGDALDQMDALGLTCTEGTPVQLFDPEEFERRVAFIEGPKR
jgi:hypothetical protein